MAAVTRGHSDGQISTHDRLVSGWICLGPTDVDVLVPLRKRCPVCGEAKLLDDFHRNRSKPDGRATECRDCKCAADQRWREANRETDRESSRRWREANPDKARDTAREGSRRWREANTDEARASKLRRRTRIRAAVFDHYGWICRCCGSPDQPTIDHVYGDGKEHRAVVGGSGSAMYRWLIRNGFPNGFQTLCVSCNTSKRNGASCRLDHLQRSA